jgi:hypothetical protein
MDISFFFIWSRFNSLSEMIRSKSPYVQFQMLQCTISTRILNHLGHGHNCFFFIWTRFNSLSEIIRSKNPYVQFQMLQGTISPRILNQLGHGHKFFLSDQGSIHYQKLSDQKKPMSNSKCFNVQYRQQY